MEQEASLNSWPHNRAIVLKNETCVYCGSELTVGNCTKEHVIGRKFVPKGKLHGEWNLIVRACTSCNHTKSDLEDDISAISLQPDAWGKQAIEDNARDAEATRKAQRSKSRRTGKPVKQSDERLNIDIPFGPGVGMSFGLVSPPQLDDDRVFRLCALHSRAFFYWITYNKTSRKGGFWPGDFFPLHLAVRSDWGNPIHRAFMDVTLGWKVRVLAIGASGFFKVAIRKHPSAICWSWAYEWNSNVRIVGFFGEEIAVQQVMKEFPSLQWRTLIHGNQFTRYREETRLSEEEDRLFDQ